MRPTYLCVCARARRRRAKREQGREVVSRFTQLEETKRTKQLERDPDVQAFHLALRKREYTDAHALSKNFAFFVAFFIACFATTLSTAIIIASPPKSLCVGGWSAVVVVVVVVVVSSREMPPTSTSSSFLRRLASLISLRRLFRPPGSRLVMCV